MKEVGIPLEGVAHPADAELAAVSSCWSRFLGERRVPSFRGCGARTGRLKIQRKKKRRSSAGFVTTSDAASKPWLPRAGGRLRRRIDEQRPHSSNVSNPEKQAQSSMSASSAWSQSRSRGAGLCQVFCRRSRRSTSRSRRVKPGGQDRRPPGVPDRVAQPPPPCSTEEGQRSRGPRGDGQDLLLCQPGQVLGPRSGRRRVGGSPTIHDVEGGGRQRFAARHWLRSSWSEDSSSRVAASKVRNILRPFGEPPSWDRR